MSPFCPFTDQQIKFAPCRACEIEANDEQVKQMPMHTCGKDGPIERAELKTLDKPNTMENTVEKLTALFKKHNPEFRFDPQVSHRWIVEAFREYGKDSSQQISETKKALELLCNCCEWAKDDPDTLEGYKTAQKVLNKYSSSVAAPKEEPKEESLSQIQIDYYENKIEGMFRNQADQEKELASLRDQLRKKNELIKELQEGLEYAKNRIENDLVGGPAFYLDSLIKKSQKL